MIKILIFFSIIGLCIYFFFGNKISKEYKKYFIIFFIVAIGLLLIFSGKLNFLPVALAPALLFFRRISSLLSLLHRCHHHHRDHPGHHQVLHRVGAQHRDRVDLFGHLHRPQLGGVGGGYLAGQQAGGEQGGDLPRQADRQDAAHR